MNATSHHPVIYVAPPLTTEDESVLGEIHWMRKELLRDPYPWMRAKLGEPPG